MGRCNSCSLQRERDPEDGEGVTAWEKQRSGREVRESSLKEEGFTNGCHLSSYKSRPGLCQASQTEWRDSQDWAVGSLWIRKLFGWWGVMS